MEGWRRSDPHNTMMASRRTELMQLVPHPSVSVGDQVERQRATWRVRQALVATKGTHPPHPPPHTTAITQTQAMTPEQLEVLLAENGRVWGMDVHF
jgi:hypothetical protein